VNAGLIDFAAHLAVTHPGKSTFTPRDTGEALCFAAAKARIRLELRRGTARDSYSLDSEPKPAEAVQPRVMRRPRGRERRPGARRRTSRASSGDSDDSDDSDSEPPPELGLSRHPKYGPVNRALAVFIVENGS
jgi:hypothetical protein